MNKKNTIIMILIIISVLCVPIAFVFTMGLFATQVVNIKVDDLKKVKDNKLIYVLPIYCIIVTCIVKYKMISSFFMLIILCSIFVAIYIINNYDETELSKEKLLKTFYIVSLIVFIIGIIQMFLPGYVMPTKWVDADQYNISRRMFSTFLNPNVFGFYVNIVIFCLVSNIKDKEKSTKLQILERIMLPLAILCLFFSFSRTAWFSLILSLGFVGLFADKKYIKYLIIITIFLFLADKISGSQRSNLSKIATDSSCAYRFELWKISLGVIKDNLLTGIGFGTFFNYTSQYSNVITKYIEHCHNMYLQITMETGIVGFVVFLCFLYNIAHNIIKTYMRDKKNRFNCFVALVFIMTLAHGMMDSVSLTPQILMIFGVLYGISTVKYKSMQLQHAV